MKCITVWGSKVRPGNSNFSSVLLQFQLYEDEITKGWEKMKAEEAAETEKACAGGQMCPTQSSL